MSIETYIKLYEDLFFDESETPVKNHDICDCGGNLVLIHAIPTCTSCGLSDISNPQLISYSGRFIRKHLYTRRSYFVELLKLIAGYKQSNDCQYNKVVKILKTKKFKTIRRLRRHMCRLGFSKFYKYIYNIFFDIKKIRLIKLDRNLIDRLADQFVKIESVFKATIDDRKNFFSYNTLIYYMLKRNNINGYKHILIPSHHSKMLAKISSLQASTTD